MWRHRRDRGLPVTLEDRAALLSPGDDHGPTMREDRLFVQSCFLANQLELVVVADNDRRTDESVLQLVAGHPRALLAGIPDVRDPEHAALFRILEHSPRIVGRDDSQTAIRNVPEREFAG